MFGCVHLLLYIVIQAVYRSGPALLPCRSRSLLRLQVFLWNELLYSDHTACLRRYSPEFDNGSASDELLHAIRSGLCQRTDSSNIEVHSCSSETERLSIGQMLWKRKRPPESYGNLKSKTLLPRKTEAVFFWAADAWVVPFTTLSALQKQTQEQT